MLTTFRRLWPVLMLAAVLTGCASSAAQPADPPPPQVSVAEVVDREITEWDEFTGRLEAVNRVDVRPRVSGYVSKVSFTEGALVRAGALLVQIDPRPFQAEVDRLRAELARAHATVERAQAELARAERLRAENAMSLEEHGRRASFAEESAAQVGAVEAALRAAELNLEFTRVTAPISGRVGRAIVTPGNLVSSGPGEATLLTTIVSLDPIHAYFDADEQMFLPYVSRSRPAGTAGGTGMPIRIAVAGDESFSREGRMDFLDNRVNPTTGTIRGRAVIANPDGELTPGLFVRLRVARNGTHRALLVQDRAIGTDLDKKFLLVVGPDRTVGYRAVTLGPLVDGLRVVRTGLDPGDRVIVNGLQRVRPGATVDPVTVPMESPDDGGAARAAAAE